MPTATTCSAFARWLVGEDIALVDVDVDVMLRFLTACREATLRGRPGGNVYSIRDGRNTGYAPATINRRLAAISALFAFREMREPGLANPVPRGRAARDLARWRAVRAAGARRQAEVPVEAAGARAAAAAAWAVPRGVERTAGQLPHLAGPGHRRADAAVRAALGRGPGPAGRRCGHRPPLGSGQSARATRNARVPLDADVAGAIQTYLLVERPETDSTALFVVAKGAHRGQPLTAAGLRTVFRYHRERAGVPAGHPHALRHSFGTALAEAGVDLSVIQALMGHDHVDSSAAYIHLAPSFLREEFDAARARLRARV